MTSSSRRSRRPTSSSSASSKDTSGTSCSRRASRPSCPDRGPSRSGSSRSNRSRAVHRLSPGRREHCPRSFGRVATASSVTIHGSWRDSWATSIRSTATTCEPQFGNGSRPGGWRPATSPCTRRSWPGRTIPRGAAGGGPRWGRASAWQRRRSGQNSSSTRIGRAKPNSAPPAGRGWAQIRPPMASTSARQTKSPIPAPAD